MKHAEKPVIPSGRELDALFDAAEIVKSGAVREVRRAGELYLKLDRRKHHPFTREFRAAAKLKKAGIPVVDPIAAAATKRGNYLITGAFDGISLDEYLKRALPDREFRLRLAQLIGQMHRHGFVHWDFHPGNVLYSPEKGTFALVDVGAVKKLPRALLFLVPEYTRFELLNAFRGVMSKEELTALAGEAGMKDPERFYREMFRRDARHLKNDWSRRRAQILAGYPKFAVAKGEALDDRDTVAADLESAVTAENGKALFLAHQLLKLMRIPHRRVFRYFPAEDKALAAPENPRPAAPEAAREMMERLAWYGISSAEEDWRQGDLPLPEFHALEKIAALPGLTGEEQP